ncbi:hypothetical protein BKA56DRAFT_682562 [Ilyonectria sp. MPI-CAGE-AT-0026]|nr:hypothetical protein BKA56DRAFT_682562 [Ilyonectria sp. MPI-CAGE-AT-0026]
MSVAEKSLPSNRKDKIKASLQALLSNDDIDLELFRPGTSWCHISDIAADQQREQTLRPPHPLLQLTTRTTVAEQNPTTAAIAPQEPFDDARILDTVLRADLSLGCPFRFGLSPSLDSKQWDGQTTLSNPADVPFLLDNHNAASMPNSSDRGQVETRYTLQAELGSFETFETTLGGDQHDTGSNITRHSVSLASSNSSPPRGWNTSSSQATGWNMTADMGDMWIMSETPPAGDNAGTMKLAGSFTPQSHHSHTKSGPSPAPSKEPADAPALPPPKRQRAHYHIERRYRAGLNEKFDTLRDLMEARKLSQILQQQQDGRPCSTDSLASTVDSAAATGSSTNRGEAKMNKAEVLHEAVVCVRELEEENEILMEHFKQLLRRLRATKYAFQRIVTIINGTL